MWLLLILLTICSHFQAQRPILRHPFSMSHLQHIINYFSMAWASSWASLWAWAQTLPAGSVLPSILAIVLYGTRYPVGSKTAWTASARNAICFSPATDISHDSLQSNVSLPYLPSMPSSSPAWWSLMMQNRYFNYRTLFITNTYHHFQSTGRIKNLSL